MKKKIDIEKLLQWALREELPKGRPVSGDIGYVIARRFRRRPLQLATQFSPGQRPDIDSLGFVPGAPHQDAEIVADHVARLATDARIETMDDARKLYGEFAPIAEGCLPVLMHGRFNQQALVISRAIAGKRPPWKFECPTPYPMRVDYRDARGALRDRPLVEGLDDDGCVVMLTPFRTRLARGQYDLDQSPRSRLNWNDPAPIKIGEVRAEYVAWHAALVSLAASLCDQLHEFTPSLPAAAALPWITGETPVSRVLSDGVPSGLMTMPLPLGPKRAPALPPLESDIARESRLWRSRSGREKVQKTTAAQG